MTTTKHKFGNMRKIIGEAFAKQDILKYYPYGKETAWDYWLTGHIDLRRQHLAPHNKDRSAEEMTFRIIEETGRAMNYLTCWGTDEGFDRQRIEAFCLWQLFHGGVAGWNKEPIVGKTVKQIEAMEKKEKDRIDNYYGNGKYADDRQKKQEQMLDKQWNATPEDRAEHDRIELACTIAHRRDYGIFQVTHFPLRRFSNCSGEPVLFYTRQQLAAILTYVDCAFENLC